jgi:DNA-binding MarR family transcriptional regulator
MQPDDQIAHGLAEWRRELPELDRSAFGIVGRISRLAVLLLEELEPVFAAHDLSGGEFDVLAALRRAGRPYRLTPSELSRALLVTSGGLTRRLHALEARGLIARSLDPDDRRSTPVVLTPDGTRLVEEVLSEHARNEERLLSGLTWDERDRLEASLQGLALSLGDLAPVPKARVQSEDAGMGECRNHRQDGQDEQPDAQIGGLRDRSGAERTGDLSERRDREHSADRGRPVARSNPAGVNTSRNRAGRSA